LGVHDLDGTIVNPSSVVEALTSTHVFYHVWAAVKQTIDERVSRGIPDSALTKAAVERVLFELGHVIMERVAGPHMTFVDPRRYNNKSAMIKNARRLVSLFKEKGIQGSRVVVGVSRTNMLVRQIAGLTTYPDPRDTGRR